MITTAHGSIRTADLDDAPALLRLYNPAFPRSALLDIRREPILPAEDDLREMLTRKEVQQGMLFAVEDRHGLVRGFCSLRGVSPEAAFGEVAVMFIEPDGHDTPLAGEAVDFLLQRAFERLRLHKVVAHCLEDETALRQLLVKHAFESSGVQREVFFSLGRWHNLETFGRFAR